MMRWCAAVLLAVAAGAPDARADANCTPPRCMRTELGDYGAFIRMRVGRVKAPFFTAALSQVQSEFTSARSASLGGHFRVLPTLVLGFELPAAPSTLRMPAGSYIDDKAVGNTQLFAEYARPAFDVGAWPVRLGVRGAVGLPTAEYGTPGTLTKNRVVEVSNAIEGWRMADLYTPGTIPLTAAITLESWRDPVYVSTRVRLPLLVRIHDGSLPDEADVRRLGFVPSAELQVGYWPLDWLGISAAGFAAVQAPGAARFATGGSRSKAWQLGVSSALTFSLADHVLIDADLLLPTGGPLRETLGIGLSLRAYR